MNIIYIKQWLKDKRIKEQLKKHKILNGEVDEQTGRVREYE